jgi:quercetin dioxygenase-like cupin family protein
MVPENAAGDTLTFMGRQLSPSFQMRTVSVAPGATQAYVEAEWVDSLVVVERGEIELECVDGERRTFTRGNSMWLVGLPLRALHNPGFEPAVLVAVSRRPTRVTLFMAVPKRSPHGPISFQPRRRLSGS